LSRSSSPQSLDNPKTQKKEKKRKKKRTEEMRKT
jgi:hypothetical protein